MKTLIRKFFLLNFNFYVIKNLTISLSRSIKTVILVIFMAHYLMVSFRQSLYDRYQRIDKLCVTLSNFYANIFILI